MKIIIFGSDNYLQTKKQTIMGDFFNIQSSSFLGGTNVHNVIKIALASYIVYKLVK